MPSTTERGLWGRAGYCPKCDRDIPAGPDACLGMIPGVTKACCGHGASSPMVHLGYRSDAPGDEPHIILTPADAETFFELVKRGDWKNVPESELPQCLKNPS